MKKYSFYLFFISLAFFTSCKVQEDIHFNKDMSGKMHYQLDMSAMRALSSQMPNFGNNEKDSIPMPPQDPLAILDTINYEQVSSQFGSLQGISNVVMKRKDGGLELMFDFKDLNALNRAYEKINMSGDLMMSNQGGFKLGEAPDKPTEPTQTAPHAYFSQKGKMLTFTPNSKNSKAQDDITKSLKEINEAAFEYKTKISFERSVKSIKSKNIQAEQQENDIIIKGSPKNLPSGAELKIKLK